MHHYSNHLRKRFLLFLSLILSLNLATATFAQQPFPPTAKHPVTNEYHGVKVIDDYQWLEDANNAAVKEWVAAQNQFSRPLLEKLPARAELAKRLKTIFSNEPVRYYSFRQRKLFFARKFAPPKNQPLLVMMNAADDLASEKTILDLNVLNPKGTTAIDFYSPSIDGRFVAVSLSEGGSEDGSVHIFETATGKELGDVIPRVNFATAGGSVAWNKDVTGFYYTRYPQGNERPKEDINFFQQVYFHKLGTAPSADTYVIGKEFPRIAEIELSATADASYTVASVRNGDGGEVAHYLMGPDGKWTQVATFADQVTTTEFGLDGKLYLLSLKGAPRGKLLAVPLANPKLALAKTIIPEGNVTINGVLPTQTRLYVTEMIGGPSEIRVFDLNGKPQMSIPTPPVSSVFAYLHLSGDEILFGSESYVEPFSWNRFDPTTKKITRTTLAAASSVSLSDAEVRREFATSKDGTKVPINIIMRKGTKLDGQNPTLLYGYGGYSVNETPFFSPVNRIWLDAGGIFVDTNIRGGGEFGDEWHRAGNLTKKQNVFDDFVACAKYLIEKKYTS
ncbi:MAG: prolyl oligopeptidase family serine peptidase, partial [Pyrinomonadaceae bacterium]